MTLPYREWSNLDLVTLLRSNPANRDDRIQDWTTQHLLFNFGRATQIGNVTPGANIFQAYHPIFKPNSSDFALVASMDQCVDYGFWYDISLFENSAGETSFIIAPYILNDPNQVDYDLVNGKYYDGIVGHVWSAYPPGIGHNYFDSQTITIGNLPSSNVNWVRAYVGAATGNSEQDIFFRNGVYLHAHGWIGGAAEPFPVGQACLSWLSIQKIRVNYLNAVVNSMSRRWVRTGTNPTLVLRGLGFDQDNAELGSTSRYPFNQPGHNWLSTVDYIDFIGQQGQGITTLQGIPVWDFTIDSDTQITIPSMPTLEVGTYEIRLRKEGVTIDPPFQVYSYAGDWRANEDGLCIQGSRMVLLVQEDVPTEEIPIIFTKWRFRNGDLFVDKYFAPMDIRSPDRFYDGRIINNSSLTKSVDDETGLPNISDITIDLANADKEFSKLLAEYTVKNQLVSIYSAWKSQPEAWKEYFMMMIVDDWELNGPIWRVTLKDFSQKYFRVVIPRYIITLDEYPNAHESAIGKPMPEVIGQAFLDGELKGAVEAYLIDDAAHKYLAARGSLQAVTEVYVANILKATPADYTISYEHGGRTYINFVADQGDDKVTFNCNGYMLADWDSINGYIQNPAYVIAFFISLIAEVPISFLDMASFDALADLMVDLGWDLSGYLIMQDFHDMATTLSELLFTYGAKIFPDNWGRFKIERKDRSTYEANIRLYDQIDAMEPVNYPQNLRELANRVKAKWEHYPCHSLYLGAAEDTSDHSIYTFDVETEPSTSPWEFKWTTLEAVVTSRIIDELLKRSFGIKRANFTVSINWVQDLNILDNFQLQDLFALDIGGEGQQGYHYFIERLSLDFVNGKIDITAQDLSWLVRQCMLIGLCSELEQYWPDASEWMRRYAYIAECLPPESGQPGGSEFSDGEPGKRICICR